MTLPVTLIVEGAEDSRFLQDFVQFHFSTKLSDKAFIKVEGNASKLHRSRSAIELSTKKGNLNILIFDADALGKDSTLTEIRNQAEELRLTLNDIFLLPNNQDSGNLESLLRDCIPQKNRAIINCIDAYATCVGEIGIENLRKIDLKSKMYIYPGTFQSSESSRGSTRSYLNPEVWDLYSFELNPLKDFLAKYLA